jgi:hypothetical protein
VVFPATIMPACHLCRSHLSNGPVSSPNPAVAGIGLTVSIDGVPRLEVPASENDDTGEEGAQAARVDTGVDSDLLPDKARVLQGELLEEVEWDPGDRPEITSVFVAVELVVVEGTSGREGQAGEGGGDEEERPEAQGILEEGFHTVLCSLSCVLLILVFGGGNRYPSYHPRYPATSPATPASNHKH